MDGNGPNLLQQFIAAGGDWGRHFLMVLLGVAGAMLGYVYRNPPEGGDMSFVAWLRLNWFRMGLEGLTCGFIVLVVSFGLEAAGLPLGIGNFVGGILGFVGTKAASEFAISLAKRRAGG